MSQTFRRQGRRAAVITVLAFAVTLAACGDDGATTEPTGTTAPTETTAPTNASSPAAAESVAEESTAKVGTETTVEDSSMTDHNDPAMADHSMAGDETDDTTSSEKMSDDTAGDAEPGAADGDGAQMDDASMAAMAWPRPWDPAQPIDFSGVPGVSAEQQAFAEDLVARTMVDLPQFSDTAELNDLGFFSIGDAGTGFEHYINGEYLNDEYVLDPNHPESVVYRVDGDQRTLVSAMFMVTDMAVDDPELEAIGGPLMQWHVHNDLCWVLTPEGPQVAGTHAPGAPCPEGQVPFGAGLPMVHVWITPHQCGPFASLEGIGAGQVDPDTEVRMDQCHEGHDSHDSAPPTTIQ